MTASNPRRPARLVLEDGHVWHGRAVGATDGGGETSGELCFNTSMSGYQEILTDPSYVGQLMLMTYPHIGNYGAMESAMEAGRPMAAGLITRAYAEHASNARREETLEAWMARHGLVGITGVDTRRVVRHIREHGVMNAVVTTADDPDEAVVARARAVPSMAGLELASRVTTDRAYDHAAGDAADGRPATRIAVWDYGVKRGILDAFAARGCAVRVLPASATLADALDWGADGLFFSNGPGDPRAMPEAVETVRAAIESGVPLFGICLGHQLMALAEGLAVEKMKVGHRGANQPVLNLRTGRVEITTQNHGFGVVEASVTPDVATVDHRNLNDGSVEGLRFARFSGFSVQYHPEARPGPHDSRYLFDDFLDLVRHPVAA